MAKVMAIANQKGGVGKTTTTMSLGIGLAREGKRVLLIDADSQANLSQTLGVLNPDGLEYSLPDIMDIRAAGLSEIYKCQYFYLYLIEF